MRISNALACALIVVATGIAGPALGNTTGISRDMPPADALRTGLNALKAGNLPVALEALNFAAEEGLVSARWKLAEMYAAGDGVMRDDFKAFQLYSEIANTHADDDPRDPAAPYVANAFVKLGGYYRTGIARSRLRPNPTVARQYFNYAASYFGDALGQLNLARMYYTGEGGDRDLIHAARWANLAADKGNPDAKALVVDISLDLAHRHLEGTPSPYDIRQATQWAGRAAESGSVAGQALYGQLLFDGDGISRQPIEGLMYLNIALARSGPDDHDVREILSIAIRKATPAEWSAAKQRADDWLKQNAVTAGPGALTQ